MDKGKDNLVVRLRGDLQLDLEHAKQRCQGDPESKADAEYADFVLGIIDDIDKRLDAIERDAANV